MADAINFQFNCSTTELNEYRALKDPAGNRNSFYDLQ